MNSRRLLLATFLIVFALPAIAAWAQEEFEIPKTTRDKKGWDVYDKPITIEAGNAKHIVPGNESPEAAAAHFFASQVRGDEKFKLVLGERPSKRVLSALKTYEQWRFSQVEIRARKNDGKGKVAVRIFMKIKIDKKEDSGEDEVELKRTGNKWHIVSLPS